MTTSISSEAFEKKPESQRMKDNTKTRLTTFIKTKFKISEEIGLEGKYNIGFRIPIKFPSQRKKIIQIDPLTRKLDICGQRLI